MTEIKLDFVHGTAASSRWRRTGLSGVTCRVDGATWRRLAGQERAGVGREDPAGAVAFTLDYFGVIIHIWA